MNESYTYVTIKIFQKIGIPDGNNLTVTSNTLFTCISIWIHIFTLICFTFIIMFERLPLLPAKFSVLERFAAFIPFVVKLFHSVSNLTDYLIRRS